MGLKVGEAVDLLPSFLSLDSLKEYINQQSKYYETLTGTMVNVHDNHSLHTHYTLLPGFPDLCSSAEAEQTIATKVRTPVNFMMYVYYFDDDLESIIRKVNIVLYFLL